MKILKLVKAFAVILTMLFTVSGASAGYIVRQVEKDYMEFLDSEILYTMYDSTTGQEFFRVTVDVVSNTAWLYSTHANSVENGVVTIPDVITVAGKDYPIISIGNTRAKCHGCYGVKGMTKLILGKNIERIDSIGITKTTALKEIVWNDKIHTFGDYAFQDNTALEFFEIPATVKTIMGNPFVGCQNLTNIVVDPMNNNFVTENDNSLYTADKTTLISILETEKKDTVRIPDGVKSLASGLFYNWDIKSIDFNGVEEIGSYLIPNSKIENITITAGIKKIGQGFNYTNKNLKTITIDPANTVMKLKNGVLYSTLTGWAVAALPNISGILEIPEDVKQIGSYLFYYNKGITTVAFPAALSYIGKDSFLGCTALKEMNLDATQVSYIDDLAFEHVSLSSVKLPSSMRHIGMQAFYENPTITKVELNEGLETIDFRAFGKTGLKKMVIPRSVKYCGKTPFYLCADLTEADVWCTNIPASLFQSCTELCKVTLHEGTETIGEYAFGNPTNLTEQTEMSPTSLFNKLEFPSTLKSIDDFAFYENSIEKIVLPPSCKFVGTGAFAFSRELESFVSEGLDTVGANMVQTAPYLTKFELNEGVTYVGAVPVSHANLSTLTLPSTVKQFGGQLVILPGFRDGSADTLFNLKVLAPIPPEIFPTQGAWQEEAPQGAVNVRQGVFHNVNTDGGEYKDVTLWVPKGSVEAYKAAPFWCYMRKIRAIEDSEVEDVDADETTTPVYYTLQGIRVKELLPGQVYVKVQGRKVEKITTF